jgi:S1-C subfamily serine protease
MYSPLTIIAVGVWLSGVATVQLRACEIANDIGQTGRRILSAYGFAIVGIEIKATARISIDGVDIAPGHIEEYVQGTVIAKNGLTVTSLGSVDINTIVRARHVAIGPKIVLKIIETSYDSIGLRFADGTVCQAHILKTNPTLDLAFLQPDSPLAANRSIVFVNLAAAAKPIVLGSYFDLSLGPKDLGWPTEVHPTTIVGITDVPRTYFLVNFETRGCPVLDSAGEPLGISVRAKSGTANGISVILPSAEIALMLTEKR